MCGTDLQRFCLVMCDVCIHQFKMCMIWYSVTIIAAVASATTVLLLVLSYFGSTTDPILLLILFLFLFVLGQPSAKKPKTVVLIPIKMKFGRHIFRVNTHQLTGSDF